MFKGTTEEDRKFCAWTKAVFVSTAELLWVFQLCPERSADPAKLARQYATRAGNAFRMLAHDRHGHKAAKDLPSHLDVPLTSAFPRNNAKQKRLFKTRPHHAGDDEGDDGDDGDDDDEGNDSWEIEDK